MAPFVLKYITTCDGTRLRTGVFEPEKKSRRICVLLSGQSEFIEKYYEVIGELNDRGFVVATFDWRGQGGSTRALSNPLKTHVDRFAAYDCDLASFMDEVVAPLASAAPVVLAHSLGGHLALRALHDKPGLFRAAILSAPMVNIATRGIPPVLVRAVTALQSACGNREAFGWGMAKLDPFLVDFHAQLCTSDEMRYARTQEFLLSHPAIRLAGPTWGWIDAANRSIKMQAAKGYVEAIDTPVLVVGAGRDRVVNIEAVRTFAPRLPRGKYVEIADSHHEILMECDPVRRRFWEAFDAFLDI